MPSFIETARPAHSIYIRRMHTVPPVGEGITKAIDPQGNGEREERGTKVGGGWWGEMEIVRELS